MKKRNCLIVILILFIMLFIALVIYKNVNLKKDNNFQDIDDIEISNILFSDIVIKYYDDRTAISFNITNNNDSDVKLNNFNIYGLIGDKDIVTFYPKYSEILSSKETISNFEYTIYVKYDKIADLYIELNELEFIEDMEE